MFELAMWISIAALLVTLGVWAYRRRQRRQRCDALVSWICRDAVEELQNNSVLEHLVDREWDNDVFPEAFGGTIRVIRPVMYAADKPDQSLKM